MNQPINWSPGVTLEGIEKQVILYAFRFYRGNKTQTSISLGISIRTLENKLEKYEQDGKIQAATEERETQQRDDQLKRARGIVGQPQVPTAPAQGNEMGTSAGPHAQSATELPEKSAVPLPERGKVQEVLHAKAAGHRHERRSR
jgi:hypothetical protein